VIGETALSITVGLVGFGFAARVLHLPLIRDAGMDIVAVVTRQHAMAREMLPRAEALPDLDSLLSRPGLDLIVIATPNHLHCPQALAALERGKHVVVDKPLALSTLECDRLIDAAATHEGRLAVFQNRRWDSDFLTLKRLIAEDRLGPVVAFEARWDRYRPNVPDRWRERPDLGGGLLYDLGAHLIDQSLCLFGMPEWLEAEVYTQRVGAIADDAFQIRMGQGKLRVSLGVSSIAADAALRYRLHGLKASFRKSGLDVQEQQLRDGMSPADPVFGLEPEAQWGELTEGLSQERRAVPAERGRWREFYQAMRRSIEEGREVPVPVPPREVRRVLQIIEAARLSSAERRRIELPG
jgi:scyllo-inositol 2-dehydrogenase (NADP+)